ncbi:MAG: D-serine ammonia-lyase [Proteobacteria bacterium]|nr:D-serine ammonia-lyase [Pseudomonadota bacterium]MBU1584817.1 D-serine ammonia-lyase [Pseudomonadota bacterium]MBU2452653.1 D-serine ammonia-lyase [Pseudomonadota bacterium]MBU2628315.1 D-serine ammonia-lyase [Pseudomonadota bacterium]
MVTDTPAEKSIRQWTQAFPAIEQIMALDPVFWANPDYLNFTRKLESSLLISKKEVLDALNDFELFSGYIAKQFIETKPLKGIIESDLVEIHSMKSVMENFWGIDIPGRLFLKKDSHLAVSGSIKARGGFYEVLKHAQNLAVKNGMIQPKRDVSIFFSKKFKDFFSHHAIGVGSTGNLGLSIGIMGKSLGFDVYVHMSADAKQWKKDTLRSLGVIVIEHSADYSKAVEHGRQQAENDPDMYFVDDENSRNLFLGYAVAGQRLAAQLKHQNVRVDETHPLFVYLPCGVGGSPGGITLGLKQIFKDNVHCFFAEPTHSPCVLLGLMTKAHDTISVQDFGIDNLTAADGLAVGRPSRFVGNVIQNIIAGIYTLEDDDLYRLLALLKDCANIYMEPSALASMAGPLKLFQDREGQKFIARHHLASLMGNATHIVWGTGGSMVPQDIKKADYDMGKTLLKKPVESED